MSLAPRDGSPLARSEDLLTEQVGGEIVAYDGVTKEAHCLGPLAALVFARADGRTSPADLAAIAASELDEPVDVTQIEQAIAELADSNLLVAPVGRDGMSRRQMLRKSALVGGVAASVPLVTSVVTPAYGAASSEVITNLSNVSALFVCGTTAYRMKWPMGDSSGNPGSPECGNFNIPGVVGDCVLTQPAGTTLSSGCLAGATVKENPNGSITFTFPAGCRLHDFVLKCAENCVGPGQNGNASIPAAGVSSPYVTAGCPV